MLKKFLSSILAIAMILSTMSVAVFADEAVIVLPDGITEASFGSNTVTDGTNYYATLANAIGEIHNKGAATLWCKPGADVGDLTHGHFCDDLTIYGNGARISSGDKEFEYGMYNYCQQVSGGSGNANYYCVTPIADGDVLNLTVDNLEGAGAWGNSTKNATLNVNITNCDNIGEVFIMGEAGTLNVSLTDCSFTGNEISNCKVYTNADGTITLTNVDFTNVDKAVNLNHKAAGTQTVVLNGCTFTNCGDDVAADEIPVRVLSSKEGGVSNVTINNCSFSGTPAGGADILLDYGVGLTEASISGTAAAVVSVKEDATEVTTNVVETETFETTNAVATVDGVPYLNFWDAVNEAADGSVVELLANVTIADWQQVNNKGITIDGNGNEVTISSVTKNTTDNQGSLIRNTTAHTNFKDITFNLCDKAVVAQLVGGTVDNVTVNGGKRGFLVDGATTFKNCTFNGQLGGSVYFRDVDGAPGSVIDGCIFNLTSSRATCLWTNEVFTNNTINGADGLYHGLTVLAWSTATVSGNVFDEKSPIEVYVWDETPGAINLTENEINGNLFTDGAAITTQFDNATIENNKLSDAALATLQTLKSDVVSTEPVAAIGTKNFFTLQSAIDSIGSAEGAYTITLLDDIEEEVMITQNNNQEITITADANDKPVITGHIQINGQSGAVTGEALTIENLAFYADGKAINNKGTAFIYNPGSPSPLRYASNVTIQNCDFYDDGESINTGAVGIKTATGGSKNWTVRNCTATGIHSFMQVKNILGLVVEDCDVNDCKAGIGLNNTASFTMTGTTMNVVDYGLRSGESGGGQPISITLEDNDITVNGNESPIIFRSGAEKAVANIVSGTYVGPTGLPVIANTTGAELDITISGGEYSATDVEAYLTDGFVLTQNQYGMYTPVADDSAEGSTTVAVTENITVSLVPVTDDATKYDIVLKADTDKAIHRFLSAELDIQLNNATETLSIKTVEGNADLKIETIDPDYTEFYGTADANVWGFHLDENAEDITANEIKIGTVVLTGVGTGTLSVATNEKNKVEAIESVSGNIVKKYVAKDNTLVLSTKAEENNLPVEVKKPTQKLTIQITFPNNILDNVVDYQDMTVTVDGKDIETKTYKLGTGNESAATLSDNKYVVEIDGELTKDHAYNIEVKGAGYRTANYRVVMTEDKVVYFWNDASIVKLPYEVGGKVETFANFLAGDIAEDNIIDKYDLAAVVSYFGRYGMDRTGANAYAKYDLNRDGDIDSEDIAYVLASFGY